MENGSDVSCLGGVEGVVENLDLRLGFFGGFGSLFLLLVLALVLIEVRWVRKVINRVYVDR